MLVSEESGARIQEPGGRGPSNRWNWIGRDHHPAAAARPRDCLDCAQMAARPVGAVGLRPGGTE